MCVVSRRDVCLAIGISASIFYGFRLIMSFTTKDNYVANYVLSVLTCFGFVASACLVLGACQRKQIGIWVWIVIMVPVIIVDMLVAFFEINNFAKDNKRFIFYIVEVASITFAFLLIVCVCITYTYIRQLRKGTADG